MESFSFEIPFSNEDIFCIEIDSTEVYPTRRGGPGTLMRTYCMARRVDFPSHAWLLTAVGELFSK